MPRQDLSWIQPSSGLMCIGPWGPSAVPDIPWTLDHQPFIPPLSFQDLKSSKRIIDHIESHLPGFLTFLAHSSFNPIVDVPLGTGISFETVYYQHSLMDTFIPIAHFHPMHKLSYSISHWRSGPDEYAPGRIYNQDSNGWTIVPYEKFNLRCSLIKRTCSDVERLEVLWLAQSGYICKETHYNLEDCLNFSCE
ncbi:hypothetical protein BT96DRAFT_106969 [Gymnopus androsaceus JB14]|uniref:Uncharacterized protein n=1 Tax=Gymnopus androsaceus JB14 TaxID=1447944 RepID=A0A6A4IEQ3_9AGAR|nr:hypothetical protein BT96DRAFT_106969 [Gymnopus androsaceus JB14]